MGPLAHLVFFRPMKTNFDHGTCCAGPKIVTKVRQPKWQRKVDAQNPPKCCIPTTITFTILRYSTKVVRKSNETFKTKTYNNSHYMKILWFHTIHLHLKKIHPSTSLVEQAWLEPIWRPTVSAAEPPNPSDPATLRDRQHWSFHVG